jgi:IS4 transposase|tara:strand:- start:3005 stop:3412 length:408 start_codon:yes stop_codon:yes gene_type:complete
MIDYKFREDELLRDIMEYVDATYGQHYAKNRIQATEVIIDAGHGEGFTIGNIIKYAQRYGKKDGYNRKDLMKVVHYAIIALYLHDEEHCNDVQSDSNSKDQNRRDRVRELHGLDNRFMHPTNEKEVQRMLYPDHD